jgi:Skp family chaperone for outer membrane proteins
MALTRFLGIFALLVAMSNEVFFAQAEPLPTTAVIIIDKERVLSDTKYGKRLDAEMRQLEAAQIADNKRLLRELEQEEAYLTELRAKLSSDEFRLLAADFDTKVQRISDEQQTKNQKRIDQRRLDQLQLLAATGPVFEQLMLDTGANVILEQRFALIWNDAINMTEVAIQRIDAFLGDGINHIPLGQE